MKIKKANNFVYFILRCIFRPYLRLHYGLKFDRKISKKIKRPCIIVSNHVTFHDQFIVGTGFKFGINFVASDSLFRNGIGSHLMRVIARPIPIAKGASDPSTVKHIMTIVKNGGAVAMFPEGNRTFFGETSNFNPTIGKLVKKLNVPLVMINMRGGFNTAPRWKEKVSKGKMTVFVKRVLEPAELENLNGDDINAIIKDELYFNEFEYNAEAKVAFKGNHKAQHLETALFYCPSCGSFHSLYSEKDLFFCRGCGAKVRLNKFGFFEKVHNAEKLPETILQWSKIQLENIENIDFSQYSDTPLFSDEKVTLYSFERAKKNEFICEGGISMYGFALKVGDKTFNAGDILEMAMQGVYKFQIYLKNGEKYMVKASDKKTNLLKYMICAYRVKHLINNEEEHYYGY